jgi:hypothetical protein
MLVQQFGAIYSVIARNRRETASWKSVTLSEAKGRVSNPRSVPSVALLPQGDNYVARLTSHFSLPTSHLTDSQ